MPIDTSVKYRSGFQHYAKCLTQGVRYITTDAAADPTVPAASTLVGLCQVPSWSQSEGMTAVEAIGSARDVAEVQGRREPQAGVRLDVSDPLFLGYAFRNHTTPGTLGTKGLPLFLLEWGAAAEYVGEAYAIVGVDCLVNSLRMDISENQRLTADLDIWPGALLDAAPQTMVGAVPTGTSAIPIIWQSVSWGPSSGGAITLDQHPRLQRVSINVSNSLQRQGARHFVYSAPSVEAAVSRTAYHVTPLLEKLQISYGFHDKCPSSMQSTFNTGEVTLYGEAPGYGAGRPFVRVVILNNHLNRQGAGGTAPSALLQFTAEVASYGITIERGFTS